MTTVQTIGTTRMPYTAAIAAAAFAGAVIIAGVQDPGYSPVSEGISALASTESRAAGVMIAGFVCLALATMAAGLSLWRHLSRPAGGLVILAGAATGVAGFARQSCSTLQPACMARESAGRVTGEHFVHNLVAMGAFVLLVVAGFVIARALRTDRRAWVVAALSLVFLVWFGSGAYGHVGGLVQRVLVVLIYGLPILVTRRRDRGRAAL